MYVWCIGKIYFLLANRTQLKPIRLRRTAIKTNKHLLSFIELSNFQKSYLQMIHKNIQKRSYQSNDFLDWDGNIDGQQSLVRPWNRSGSKTVIRV